MTGLFKLAEFVFTCLEVEMACVLCNSLFEKKWRFSFWILELGALYCIGATHINAVLRNGMFSNTAWIINIVFLCLLLKICYRTYWYEAFSILTVFYAVLFSTDFLVLIAICLLTHHETFGMNFLHTFSGTRTVILCILRSADILLTALLMKKKWQLLKIVKQGEILLVLLSVICFYFMIQLQNVQIMPVNFDFVWTYAGDLLGLLGTGCLYSLWAKHQMDTQTKAESQYLQQTLLQSFAHAKAEMLEASQKLHDEKKHLRTIKLLLEKNHTSAAMEYLCELDASLVRPGQEIWSGNEILDLILNWKIAEAAGKNIPIHIDTNVFPCTLPEQDLCILLGNLLDNAIEASENIEEKSREIYLKLRGQGNMLHIYMKNSYYIAPQKTESRFLSAKRGFQAEGHGTKIVQDVVARHQGKIDLYYDKEKFYVKAMLVMS